MINKIISNHSDQIKQAAAGGSPGAKRNTSRIHTTAVEYSMIANLVVQQYQADRSIRFDALLAIPLEDRIPGLMERYGKKTMYRLLVMILKEFFASLVLPRYKKPSETKIEVTACELMLTSAEDQLSLEDVILFLQRLKSGHYGAVKSLADPRILFTLLELYRQARHEAYQHIKAEQAAAQKALNTQEDKAAPEPTPISELLPKGYVVEMNKKMSG